MRKLIAVLFIFLLFSSICSVALAAEYRIAANKISPELTAALNESDSVMAMVQVRDVDHEKVMEVFKSTYPSEYAVYMYAKFGELSAGKVEYSDEALQRAIELKREVYSQTYLRNNLDVLEKYLDKSNQIYFSKYAPMVLIEADERIVRTLARNDNIVSISRYSLDISDKEKVEMYAGNNPVDLYFINNLVVANQISRADYVRDTLGFTGAGVKVGIVESSGLPDITIPYLHNANIITDPNYSHRSDHATQVASIIVASSGNDDFLGVAPDVELYCTTMMLPSQFIESVEWLISSGVNVINASMGFPNENGEYSSLSAWVDHIAVLHDVHYVNAAGNDDVFVRMQGMAYNAITVGGFTSGYSHNIDYFVLFDKACYEEADLDCAQKPNLVAKCDFKNPADANGHVGTSYAAPQVTGVIAQICEYDSFMKIRQTAVGAVLMASAAEKVNAIGSGRKGDVFAYNDQITPQISEYEGAGILNALWTINILDNSNEYTYSINPTEEYFVQTVSINASINTVNRVALFWLKRNTFSLHGNNVNVLGDPLSNLDLYIFDPDGNLLGCSALVYNNYEIVQFVAEESGVYTIVITGFGTNREHVGIALW